MQEKEIRSETKFEKGEIVLIITTHFPHGLMKRIERI
jgi:hypothetical protein